MSFLLTPYDKDAVSKRIFKFFNLKSFIKAEINCKSSNKSHKIFVTLHPIYKQCKNYTLK